MFLLTYQILAIIISILAIALVTYRYRKDSFSTKIYLSWILIWILVIIATLFPGISIFIANLTGLGRGLDLLYIIAILILFYILFKVYNKIDDQKRRINELVSELAIKNNEEDEN